MKHALERINMLFTDPELTSRQSELQEISDYCMPGYQSFTDDSSPLHTQERRLDNSPAHFLKILATTVFNGAMSPGTVWQRYRLKDKENTSEDSQFNLKILNEKHLYEFTKAGSRYSSEMFSVLESAIAFGPGVLAVDYSSDDGIMFKAIPISQVAFSEDYNGEINTLARKFKMTASDIKEKWPEYSSFQFDNLLNKYPDVEVEIVQCVWKENGKYVYRFVNMTSEDLISEYTEKTFNFIVFRWARHSGEVYGHGQGKIALGFMRSTTGSRADLGRALQWLGDPLYLASDDIPQLTNLRNNQENPLSPGALVVGGLEGSSEKVKAIFGGGNINASMGLYEMEQENLKKAFFVDKIELPKDSTRRTAFEISSIAREEVKYLTPFISNLELGLKKLADLVLAMLKERGKFKDLDIDTKDIEIEFLSPLSRQFKMEDARSLGNFLELSLGFMNLPEEIAQALGINRQNAIKTLAEATGVPPGIMNSDADTEAAKAKLQEAMQMQQQAAAADVGLKGSQIIKNTRG